MGHGPLTWITLAGRIQADRDGLDLFTVADPRTAVTSWTRTR